MIATKVKPRARQCPYGLQSFLIGRADEADDICDVMADAGLSIDDLIYENSRSRAWSGRRPAELGSFRSIARGVPIVSFFMGCGGMDLGFEAVGFSSIAAFEHNEVFCRTLRANRPDWTVFGPPFHNGDVSDTPYASGLPRLAPLILQEEFAVG